MQGPLTAAMVGFQISIPDSKVVMVGHSQNEPGPVPRRALGVLEVGTRRRRPGPRR